MIARRYLDRVRTEYRGSGPGSALVESLRLPYVKALQIGNRWGRAGENVYDDDWDVLVVLDACRSDLMQEVLAEGDYDLPSAYDSLYSLDSATAMWMRKTFVPEFEAEMADTVYVCGNPYSRTELDEDRFALLDEVWSYAWDEDRGTLPARPVTDRAISLARSRSPDRLVVHYMQPHCPFVDSSLETRTKRPTEFGDGTPRSDIWTRLRRGELSTEAVWRGYRENLAYVLEDVELLLDNVDADDVVVTSDHGNALGERWLYGHPWRMPVRCLREVPWIRVSARDSGKYEPELEREAGTGEDATERLRALGYR